MVEGGGLENRCAARYRGFESPLLRLGIKYRINTSFGTKLILQEHWGFEPERCCKNSKANALH